MTYFEWVAEFTTCCIYYRGWWRLTTCCIYYRGCCSLTTPCIYYRGCCSLTTRCLYYRDCWRLTTRCIYYRDCCSLTTRCIYHRGWWRLTTIEDDLSPQWVPDSLDVLPPGGGPLTTDVAVGVVPREARLHERLTRVMFTYINCKERKHMKDISSSQCNINWLLNSV